MYVFLLSKFILQTVSNFEIHDFAWSDHDHVYRSWRSTYERRWRMNIHSMFKLNNVNLQSNSIHEFSEFLGCWHLHTLELLQYLIFFNEVYSLKLVILPKSRSYFSLPYGSWKKLTNAPILFPNQPWPPNFIAITTWLTIQSHEIKVLSAWQQGSNQLVVLKW